MDSTLAFIPGLQLSEIFYHEAVKPLLEECFPRVAYTAARLGRGSDVLGFDTPRSMDHDWGPKLSLFLSQEDDDRHGDAIIETLRERLPYDVQGYPTHFASPERSGGRLQWMVDGPVNHGVTVWTLRSFFAEQLEIDPYAELTTIDWLTLPQQRLRTIVAGRVFYDGLGELEMLRAKFDYYPRDIWLYLLAVQWRRIAQEQPFMGRCGDVGDELGSRILAARLARDVMRLCFLIERTYIPYSKWLGSAFARLRCAPRVGPLLEQALQASSWLERERRLSSAYEDVAAMHNALGLTDPLPTHVSRFHDRPYLVIDADRFVEALRAAITSEEVRRLPPHIGSVDQFVDSTDVLDNDGRFAQLRALYTTTGRIDTNRQ